jgi:glucosyl-3-phosphoglycerate synthase
MINSLQFDRHQERTAVEVFLKGMKLATQSFIEDPLGVPMISNWSRVVAAVPDVFGLLIDAVESDHEWKPTSELAHTDHHSPLTRVS